MRRTALLSAALALVSVLLVRPAPSYDPWAWLLWGRELAAGRLSTVAGPAFKPLPVLVCALLAPLGGAAPLLWSLLARFGSVLACGLGFRLAQFLGGGSVLAGALGALGVALCRGHAGDAASGMSEGLLLALLLLSGEAWRAERPRTAYVAATAAALLRVETWPFLLLAAVPLWRRHHHRPLLVAAAVLVPLAWFGGELLGSGTLLRSATRARVPNPGQPALADLPALAALREAAAVPLWPVWPVIAVLAWWAWRHGDVCARRAMVPAGLGLAWIGIVAVMAQFGFSGEARYALPGAALVTLSAAAATGLAERLRPRWPVLPAAVALSLLLTVPSRASGLSALAPAQAYQWRLQDDLAHAVAAAGGRDAVLACGRPFVGPLRGPLLAYRLDVPKHVVEPDRPPRSPGVVFRSALDPGAEPAPAVPPGFPLVLSVPTWQVFADCHEQTG